MPTISIAALPRGWVRALSDDWPGVVYLRLEPNARGRWETRELYLDGDGGWLSPQMLRSLNLSMLEGLANEMRDDLEREYERVTAGDLATLASHIGVGFGTQASLESWVVAAYRADAGELPSVPKRSHTPPRTGIDTATMLTSGPGEDGLSDAFLRRVAAAYYAALARGESAPNRALAQASGYSQRTVERWVYTARQRGIMPKARKGAAG